MQDTKGQIIEVATRLFAAGGYEGVSVRDICRMSEVSVAMVNYHFRNKEGLYRECVERLFQSGVVTNPGLLAASVNDAASWRKAVRAWVKRFSEVMHAKDGEDALAGRIYRQEIVHASPMHEYIVSHYAGPVRDGLMALLEMAGLDEAEAFRWASAVWSLLSAYAIVDPVWRSSFRPDDADEATWAEQFADFVCERIFKELRYHGKRR